MRLSEKDLTTKSMIAVAKEYGYTIPREETRYPFTHEEWTTIRRAVRTAKHNVMPVLRLLAAENRTQVLHRIIGFLIASHKSVYFYVSTTMKTVHSALNTAFS